MKRALFAVLILLAVTIRGAVAGEPDATERQAIDTWSEYQAHLAKDAIDANAKLEASLAALIRDIETLKTRQAATDAYWKAWCGDRPGCQPR